MTAPARFAIVATLVLLLPLFGCSSIDERPASPASPAVSGDFPVPPEIRPNVDFWTKVYGEWSRGKAAIHDDEYMSVIYEVAVLPGPILEGYTPEQQRFLEQRKAHYVDRLAGIEAAVRAGATPAGYDKALYTKLVDAGGVGAVHGAAERVRVQRGLRERFHRGLEISGRYDAAFRQIFRSRGQPEDLAYLPHVESSFQAHAVSKVGAAGMWQFTKGTGKIYMTVDGVIDERLDPVIAAEGAASYLGDAYRKLGSWPLAVTSYNHGQGGMMQAKATYGNDIGRIVRHYKGPHFKFSSRNFYANFVAAREVASHPARYFPEGVNYHRPLSEDRLVLGYDMPAPQLARHYGVATGRLASLNRHWMEPARDGRARLPAGCTVWLPDGTLGRVASLPAPEPAQVQLARAERKAPAVQVAKAQTTSEPKRPAGQTEPRPESPRVVVPPEKPEQVASAAPPAAMPPAGSAKPEPTPHPSKAKTVPEPARVAEAKPKAAPSQVADTGPSAPAPNVGAAPPQVAKVEAKAPASPAAANAAKVHVVKPNETLYRVATIYDLSVDQLRRLNSMGPKDTNIRPGQRLRVSG